MTFLFAMELLLMFEMFFGRILVSTGCLIMDANHFVI